MDDRPLRLHPVSPLSTTRGFPLNHPYVENVFPAMIGPTGVLLLRRAGLLFEAFPQGLEVDAAEFARSLGIGHAGADQSLLARTLTRLDRFGLVAWDQPGATLAVPTHVRPLTARQIQRAPQSTRVVHASLIETLKHAPPAPGRDEVQLPTGPAISLGLSR